MIKIIKFENDIVTYKLEGGKLQCGNQLKIESIWNGVYDKTITTFLTEHMIQKGLLKMNIPYKFQIRAVYEDGTFSDWSEDFYYEKIRGFEIITQNQALKDFEEKYIEEADLLLPKRGTSKSAGYDIFAPYDITLQPNEEIKVPTGLKAYMQDGEVLMAFPRSGLGFKFYCRLANTVGIIDSDYYNNSNNEGHMFVKLRNEGKTMMTIKQGEGMCQMIFMPFLIADNDSFDEGETRQGGFGSTTKLKENK